MPTIQFTSRGTSASGAARALARAAVAASSAPSLLDGRTWQWRIADDRAELRADLMSQPDPTRRRPLLIASGGAALHHACAALAGAGAVIEVARLPELADPDLLARILVTGFTAPSPAAVRMHRAIALRRADGPGYRRRAVPSGTAGALSAAAEAHGAYLRPVGTYLADGRWDMVLAAEADTAPAWLRAGEAYSAVSLSAAAEGLVMAPAPGLDRMSFDQVSQGYEGPGYPLAVLTIAGRGPAGNQVQDSSMS